MTKTLTSPDSGKTYFLDIDDETGHAAQCSCPDRQHRSYKPCCKHMSGFNAEVAKAETFLALKERFDVRSQAARDADRTAYLYYEMNLGL